jgi:antitoxin component of RelBE/YafQ-DinJ toxin-antitoxin module
MAETKLLSARVPEALYRQVKEVSRKRGEDLSDFIRRAILKELASLGFLPEDQKKALGLSISR